MDISLIASDVRVVTVGGVEVRAAQNVPAPPANRPLRSDQSRPDWFSGTTGSSMKLAVSPARYTRCVAFT